MAKTFKIAKYVQVPGPGEFTRPSRRRAPARPPALYLLQLRSTTQTRFAPRRLTISVASPAGPDARTVPVPVKITYR
jgi:hypothetical protein